MPGILTPCHWWCFRLYFSKYGRDQHLPKIPLNEVSDERL